MAGNIKGITIEFQGDTSKLDKALRNVSNSARGIDKELRQVDKALKFNPTSVDLWRQKQTLLTQKINETRTKLDLLKQKQAQMDASGVDKNSAEYRKLQREIIETESKLKHFEGELRKVGNVNLRALGEQFKQIGAKMTAVGKDLTTKVTLPLAAVGTVAAKKFAEVDKTMQLTNSTMGNSAAEAELLNKAMKSAAASSTYGMSDAATATLNFARAGLSAQQAADALAPAMALAAGEGGELDTVSAGLVATINGFHGSFDQAAEYADVFANACNNSALDVNSLSHAMSVAAPIFSSAGYSVKDAALYMGVMANNGIDADKAANSLKTGLARLVSPAKEGAQMMEKLGISVTNADGTMKDSVTIQKELHDAFSQLSESEQIAAASAIFGKNQMAPWLALINTAPGDVDALSTALDKNGTAMEMQSAMMSGFAGSIEQLKSGIDVMLTSLGEALAPVIQKVVKGLQALVDWFNGLSPAMQTVIATIGVIVAAIGPLLVIIGTIMTAIGGLMTAVPGIIGALGGFAPVIAIIAAVAAAFVLLWTKSEQFRAAVTAGVEQIKTALLGVFQAITPLLAQLKTAISQLLVTIAPIAAKVIPLIVAWITNLISHIGLIIAIVVKLVTLVAQAVTSIIQFVTKLITAIKTAVTSIIATFNSLKAQAMAIFNSIKATITSIWNGIKSAVSSAANTIKSNVTAAFNGLKGTMTSVWNGIKDAITHPIQTAVGLVRSAISKIKGIINGAHFSLPHIKLPHFRISGKLSLNPPSVPHVSVSWYKTGGIFDSPSVIGVGEAGPEAVVPLDKLWSKLDAIAAASAQGEGVTINVYASPGMDINQLAAAVEERLVRLEKQRVKAWGY